MKKYRNIYDLCEMIELYIRSFSGLMYYDSFLRLKFDIGNALVWDKLHNRRRCRIKENENRIT